MTSTHGTLVSLLEELESLEVSDSNKKESSNDAAIVVDEKRLLKRVTLLHRALVELGFNDDNMVQEIVVNTNAISLEACLDWACLHFSGESLPSFLTDANTLEVERMLALDHHHEPLTVVTAARKNKQDESNDENGATSERNVTMESNVLVAPTSLEPSTKRCNADDYDEDEDFRAAQKARLLAQYQYEDTEDDVEEEEDISAPTAEQQEQDLSPLRRLLHQTEMEYQELSSILQDETQQYMMSKYEIKEAKKKHRTLQKQLDRLRADVQREEASRKQQQETDDNDIDENGAMADIFGNGISDEDEDDEFGGSLFDMDNEMEPAVAAPVPAPAPAPAIPDYSIPPNWTGKTPVQVLQERCKKLKLPPPQFHKRGTTNGGVVTIKTKPSHIDILEEGPFHSWKDDCRNYLATRALYEMDSTLPLYRLLPPVFRDLWQSWLNAAKQEKLEQEKEVSDAQEAKMKQVVDAILSRQQEQQRQRLAKASNGDTVNAATPEDNALEQDDVPDTWDDSESEEETIADVQLDEVSEQGTKLQSFFRKRQTSPQYQSMLQERKTLPMFSYRQQLLDTIEENQVTVLCAETGAGKTTQCGQFLLETALKSGHGDKISILCTQPRRVSAISVAERVSEEFGDGNVGDTIGYHIRLESKCSARTKLLFCTTGVVLRRLQDDPDLEGVTHVLVDEVHERQWQIDFLLIALRRLVNTTRKDLKIVLMSATLDAELFTQFFPGAPLLKVPGRTFPVTNYYLEDLMDATNHVIEEGSRYAIRNRRDDNRSGSLWVTTKGGEKRRENYSMDNDSHLEEVSGDYIGYKMTTRRSMDRVNEQVVNYDLIEDVLARLLVNPENNDVLTPPDSNVDISAGAVLIFLPGAGEIQTLRERLEGSRMFGNRKRFDVIPMHSTLSPKDQRRAFVKSRPGCQKIILATNIAETSVTIPDVVCVIDSGLVREVHQNKRTSTSTLVTTWCSRASIKQRSGRAGRVQAGICCRLFSSGTTRDQMKDQAVPELQRVPLEEVCLSILAGRLGKDCMDFLQQAPQPPSEKSVSLALDVLKDVGAIDADEQLTPLGYHLSKLPMDVRLGKMLIFGALFHCLHPILTIAASLSCKSPFPSYARDSLQAQARHKTFQHGNSDFMTICNVYNAYQEAHGNGKSRKFCDDNFLSRSALMEIKDTRDQYLSLLYQIGFVMDGIKGQGVPKGYNQNGSKESVVHAVICAGLYPNVALVESTKNGVPSLVHNKEKVNIHKSSVNAAKNAVASSDWVVFYEKFATHKVYVSDTALVHPFSLLLFGGPLAVKHQDRKVLVGDWIEIPVAAQTAVLFRELRVKLDDVIKHVIEKPRKSNELTNGIVKLIESGHRGMG